MKKQIHFIQSLRGLACLMVVYYHLVESFWVKNALIAQIALIPPIQAWPFYASWLKHLADYHLNLGIVGVGIFLLISGFVMPRAIQRVRGWTFIHRRIIRIYPVYIIGLTLTVGVLWLSARFHHFLFPFSGYHLLTNYFLVHDWAFTPSIDQVNWVLLIELKFYGLMVLWKSLFKDLTARLLWISALLLAGAAFLTTKLMVVMPPGSTLHGVLYTFSQSGGHLIFVFLGVGWYQLYRGHWTLPKTLGVNLVLWGLSIFSLYYGQGRSFFWEYLIGYGLALVIFGVGYLLQNKKPNRLLVYVGKISYPIYVIHALNGYVTMYFLLRIGLRPWLALLLVLALVMALAMVIHYAIEEPTRNWFRNR